MPEDLNLGDQESDPAVNLQEVQRPEEYVGWLSCATGTWNMRNMLVGWLVECATGKEQFLGLRIGQTA